MTSLISVLRRSLSAAVLCIAASTAAHAQTGAPPVRPDPQTVQGGQLRLPGQRNQELLDQALRDAGFSPRRLRQQDRDALEAAWARLLPEANPRRYQLNRYQAAALVYVALVLPRGGGRGGWNGDDRGGWNDGRGGYQDDRDDRDDYDDRDTRGGRGGAQCRDLQTRVYDVINQVYGNDGRSLFLSASEKQQVRASAMGVQRTAADLGYRGVADRATDVIASVSTSMPDREQVLARARSMKAAADQACGADRNY